MHTKNKKKLDLAMYVYVVTEEKPSTLRRSNRKPPGPRYAGHRSPAWQPRLRRVEVPHVRPVSQGPPKSNVRTLKKPKQYPRP